MEDENEHRTDRNPKHATDDDNPAVRVATCRCGQLRASCIGEPVRVSVCHCLECQKRIGSAFTVQARWPDSQVEISGNKTHYAGNFWASVEYESTGDPVLSEKVNKVTCWL